MFSVPQLNSKNTQVKTDLQSKCYVYTYFCFLKHFKTRTLYFPTKIVHKT